MQEKSIRQGKIIYKKIIIWRKNKIHTNEISLHLRFTLITMSFFDENLIFLIITTEKNINIYRFQKYYCCLKLKTCAYWLRTILYSL